jgi:hypothetical protein
MSDNPLPELPEPDGSATVIVGSERIGRYVADVTAEVDAWSETLLRAYGQQCYAAGVAAERERQAPLQTDAEIDAVMDQQWGKGLQPNQYLAHRAASRAIERAVLQKAIRKG